MKPIYLLLLDPLYPGLNPEISRYVADRPVIIRYDYADLPKSCCWRELSNAELLVQVKKHNAVVLAFVGPIEGWRPVREWS